MMKKNTFPTVPVPDRRLAIFLIALSICLAASAGVYAQNQHLDKGKSQKKPIFEKAGEAALSSSEREKLSKLKKSKKNKRTDVVRLPKALYKEMLLTFTVNAPTGDLMFGNSGGETLTIVRKDIEVLSDEEIAWTGTIRYGLNEEEVGDVTLIQNREGAVTGTIDLEGTFYEIRPLGRSNMHAVRLVGTGYMEEMYKESDVVHGAHSGAKYSPLNQVQGYFSGSLTTQGVRCSPEYQRLLVVYTANAARNRDINGIISLSIQETHESYSNSQVGNLRIAVAHKQQISFSESSDARNDLNRLKANSTVQNLRNQYNADAVILLTDGNYGSTAGIADAILATSNTAFAIVQAENAAGPDYTFPHELGHLQGAQHHPDDPVDPNGPFSYGFGHRFS